MRIRLGLSAKVSHLKFPTTRTISFIHFIHRLPRLGVNDLCSRFTATSDPSPAVVARRRRQFRTTVTRLGRRRLLPPHLRLTGATTALTSPTLRCSVIQINLKLCNLCPTPRLRSILSLQPIVRIGTQVARLGSLPTKAKIDCNRSCIARHPVHVTIINVNCTSNIPHVLSGQIGIVIEKRLTRRVNAVAVSRLVISIDRVPGLRRNSIIALLKRSNPRHVAPSS